MKKVLTGMVIGATLTYGAMTLNDSYIETTIEPITQQYTTQEETNLLSQKTSVRKKSEVYAAKIKKDDFFEFIQDSKAAPCFCRHREQQNSEWWCEHEEFVCNEDAADWCERQDRSYKCYAGILAIIPPPADLLRNVSKDDKR